MSPQWLWSLACLLALPVAYWVGKVGQALERSPGQKLMDRLARQSLRRERGTR